METKNEAADSFLEQLHQDVDQAVQNLRQAQERQKRYADRRRRVMEFEVGDEVLLSTRNLTPVLKTGGSKQVRTIICGSFVGNLVVFLGVAMDAGLA